MIYTPKKAWLWDSWIVPYKGKYYLFHLSLSEERQGKGGWDGISLAISEDLIHFKEIKEVIHRQENSLWVGTGMVQIVDDRFIMNFSEECPAGVQNIYFAESTDLINWKRIDGITLKPDGINYMNSPRDLSQPYPRWDSLGIVDALENKQPPYYAFLTASGKKVKEINKNGALGLVTSEDGLNWKCLPSAFADTNMFPQFEVPEHIEINGRHYVLFCTSSYLSHRFDRYAKDMSGGTFYVVSDNVLGPYRLPDGDYMLQGTRDNQMVSTVTVGRPLKVNNEYYYYHIWSDKNNLGALGTIKLLEEVKPYELRLRYNHINDKLYGKLLASTSDFKELSFIKNEGSNPPLIINYDDKEDSLVFESLGTAGALDSKEFAGSVSESTNDLRDGRIVEFNLKLTSGCAGFYFLSESNERFSVAINKDRNRVEFGKIEFGWGPNVVIKDEIIKPYEIKGDIKVKLLVRKTFFEIYIDDLYVSSWCTKVDINPNKYGFYFEEANGCITETKIYEMQ